MFAMVHNYMWYNDSYYLQTRGVAMGAKFVPSLANLFMVRWEEGVIYSEITPKLLFWRRYIDDVLLWSGSKESLILFIMTVNNERGISLSFESSEETIHFLDLEIGKCGDSLITKTFYRP